MRYCNSKNWRTGTHCIRKKGWNVLNQYFGVETKPIKSWRTELEDGEYMITVVVQTSYKGIIGPARSASCTSMEMRAKHHNKTYLGMESHCYGMAETRAVGRASAAWFMVGDPSAEEVGDQPFEEIPPGSQRACKCKEGAKCEKNSRKCTRCGGMDLS